MKSYFAVNFARSELLREMQPHLLEAMASIAIERTATAGEILFMQQQEATGFYLICTGSIKIFRAGSDGREQVMHVFGEGEIVGEVPVFQGSAYPACGMAVTDCELVYFGRVAFVELGKKQPEILFNMLAILSRRLRHFVELVDDLSLKDVTTRLAKYLTRNCHSDSKCGIDLDQTKGALAASLGTIPATLSRTFKKLQELSIIKVKGNQIEILNCQLLKEIANGEKIEGL